MALYSTKYNAKRIPGTTKMVIADEDGDNLAEKYLGRQQLYLTNPKLN